MEKKLIHKVSTILYLNCLDNPKITVSLPEPLCARIQDVIIFMVIRWIDYLRKFIKLPKNIHRGTLIRQKNSRRTYKTKEKYSHGDKAQSDIFIDKLKTLTGFYPVHIKKEDDLLFSNSEKYFSEEEQHKILDEFWKFDRKMTHEKYKSVVERYEDK